MIAQGTALSGKPAGLRLEGLQKRFGDLHAVRDLDLEIKAGEFFTLLGPSGCGKTTLLRIIAGFELADAGRVLVGDSDLSGKSASARPINTVFQSYALFPHLTVQDNVAFGLVSRRVPRAEIAVRVQQTLELMRLGDFATRHPHQLSGGQKQRVAMARALVNAPKVLLLDEPMSALDAQLRSEVQLELRKLQRALGTTFVLVTHDQDEAMTVSDRICVLSGGRVQQVGTPEEVYARPRSRFVAEFLGAANLIPAGGSGRTLDTPLGPLTLEQDAPWSQGTLALRAENVVLLPTPSAVNGMRMQVLERIYHGTHLGLTLGTHAGAAFTLKVRTAPFPPLELGETVWAHLPPQALVPLLDETQPAPRPPGKLESLEGT